MTGVKGQIAELAAVARKIDKLGKLVAVLEEGVRRLKTDPHGYGDPEYRAKHVDAVHCHLIVRPLAFRYVIFEDTRSVLILNIKLIAEFS